MAAEWTFSIDRGGTFTDIVAHGPDGQLVVRKLLSENPGQYDDAATAGIQAILADQGGEAATVKMGTTVATNALLERRGAAVALVTTEGFADVIEIARQDRPSLYDDDVDRPEPLVPRWRRCSRSAATT